MLLRMLPISTIRTGLDLIFSQMYYKHTAYLKCSCISAVPFPIIVMNFGSVWQLGVFGNWECLGIGSVWQLGVFGNWECLGIESVWQLEVKSF